MKRIVDDVLLPSGGVIHNPLRGHSHEHHVIHEVWTDTVGAQLGLPWCRYSYPSPVLYGYQFVSRDDQGHILPEGTTPITRAAFMFELIQKATDAGWFVTAELDAGAGQ